MNFDKPKKEDIKEFRNRVFDFIRKLDSKKELSIFSVGEALFQLINVFGEEVNKHMILECVKDPNVRVEVHHGTEEELLEMLKSINEDETIH